MDLEELKESWKYDSHINKNDPGNESLNIPSLHSKYWNILSSKRLLLKKLQRELKIAERQLRDWIKGRNEGQELGRGTFQFIVTKEEEKQRIETDPIYIRVKEKIELVEEEIEYIRGVIDMINGRSFQINNAIKFLAFSQGQYV